MDLFSLNIFTLFIIPFIIFLVFMHNISKAKTRTNLPPGPWKFPIIGSLPHLLGYSLPHQALTALAKKHGPIIHLQLGEISTVVISSARLAKEALKTHDLAMSERPQLLASKIIFYNNGDLAFAPHGDYWIKMNKICISELLSAKKVKSFRPLRMEEVSRFIDSIRSSSSQSPINLGRMVYSLQNTIVCKAVFGRKCKDQEELIDLIMKLVLYMGGFDAANLFPSFKLLPILNGSMSKMKRTHKKLDKILDEILDEHRENFDRSRGDGEEDLVDVLLRLKEKGGLDIPITFDNIKAVTLDMFAAGSETSSTTVEWAMSELIRNPRVMEKAQAELRDVFKGTKVMNETDLQDCSYLKLVVKETLRLRNPSALLFPRQCREQCEIEGYTIPIKTTVIVNYSAIARDPEYWHDPENFLPERFENSSIDFKGNNFEFIPFGAGRRICPGMLFGIAGVELVLAQLLYHFDWELPNRMKPEDLDMSETFGVALRKKNNLYLIATPYSSL